MKITLTFHTPAMTRNPSILSYELTDAQSGLIPNINDRVRIGTVHCKIIEKNFIFHPGSPDMEIEFATE